MSKRIIAVAIVCTGLIATYGAWLYATHFFYKRTEYTIGTKNQSEEVLHAVTINLFPAGRDICGVLDKGQEKRLADPPWPLPDRITITFNEDTGSPHEISLKTDLPKNFRGKLTVLITKTDNVFAATLQSTKQKD